MKKVLIIIFVLTILGIGITFLNRSATQEKALETQIDAYLTEGKVEIDLTLLTDFEWSKVNVFQPYTSTKDIESAMAIKFRGDNGGIDLLDDRYLLVFANEKRAIKTVVLSRKYGNYRVLDQRYLIIEK